MQLIVLLILLAVIATVGVVVLRKRARPVSQPSAPSPVQEAITEAVSEPAAPHTTPDIDATRDECFKLAFSVPRFDYLILGEHATVLEQTSKQLQAFVPDQSYLPRRPMLLPRLMQALNDEASDRHAVAQMILQDPALAGGVLQRANTAYYRTTVRPTESVERALAMLGTDGVRAILATLILQPLFRLPAGYFDHFAPITWDQAQRAGFAAQVVAQRTGSADRLAAQLLALISALSRIVLFRFTTEKYREMPDVLPRAEVFIRLMQRHGPQLGITIAKQWELSAASLRALQEQIDECPPASMSPLGRTLYFADLCGALAVLVDHSRYNPEGAFAILRSQGLDEYTIAAAWEAAQQSAPARKG
ncbi:MAG: HDOD domain-containing protein [Steroidobacteraceae bacterium]